MTKMNVWNPWGIAPRGFFDLDENFDFDFISNVQLDLYEEGENYVVELKAPGFNKEDIDISIEGNQVTVSGNVEDVQEDKEKKRKYYKKEIRNLSFTRTCDLPGLVNSSKAQANFKDGLLKVTLPKTEEAKPKKLEVKEG